MSSLPDILKIPDGPEKLLLPSANLPVSDLIKFPLCNPFYCSISIF
jgi:hypothetical protein